MACSPGGRIQQGHGEESFGEAENYYCPRKPIPLGASHLSNDNRPCGEALPGFRSMIAVAEGRCLPARFILDEYQCSTRGTLLQRASTQNYRSITSTSPYRDVLLAASSYRRRHLPSCPQLGSTTTKPTRRLVVHEQGEFNSVFDPKHDLELIRDLYEATIFTIEKVKIFIGNTFGHLDVAALERLRNIRDERRPLFGSDEKSRTERVAVKDESSVSGGNATNKNMCAQDRKRLRDRDHSKSERDRRWEHKVYMAIAGRLCPDAIIELTGYKPKKAPDKFGVFRSTILLQEFDCLLRQKQAEEIAQLKVFEQRALEYERVFGPLPSPSLTATAVADNQSSGTHCLRYRCRSPSSDQEERQVSSPRKRQKFSPPKRTETLSEDTSEVIHQRSPSAHSGLKINSISSSVNTSFQVHTPYHNNPGDKTDGCSRRTTFVPRCRHSNNLPSPSPSTTGSWRQVSRRSQSPPSA